VGGANWDIIWHGIVNVESFFTPPHTVIYSGVALAIIAILVGIIKSIKSNSHLRYHQQQQQQQGKQSSSFSLKLLLSYIPFPLRLAAAGSLMQLFSGRFDYWWHSNFGFDGLLSPPHFLLVVGMVMSILGALIGIYNLKNLTTTTTTTSSSEVRIQETKERNKNSHFINISFLFAYAIFWMVAVNTVFMFTLPYSKGQYFDFNPDPFAAIITASLLIPLITGMIFFIVTRTNKTPFMFTLITAFFMVIQSTATIISNTYFVTLYPLYLLNILSALAADVIVLQYGRRRKAKETTEIKSSKITITATTTNTATYRSIIAPAIVSIFFITLFFPWSVNVYKTYFGIHLNTFGSVSIFGQLLWTIIIPVIMPIAAVMSIVGSYIVFKLMNTAKTRKRIFI